MSKRQPVWKQISVYLRDRISDIWPRNRKRPWICILCGVVLFGQPPYGRSVYGPNHRTTCWFRMKLAEKRRHDVERKSAGISHPDR
jgi:hypothetical protein